MIMGMHTMAADYVIVNILLKMTIDKKIIIMQ
jgi:hypothetical protein